MKEYIFEGQKYIFTGKKWVDSKMLAVPLSIVGKLNNLLKEEYDFNSMSDEDLLEFAGNVKDGENIHLAVQALEVLLERADLDILKRILPRLLSCYRKIGKIEKAIETGEHYLKVYSQKVSSPALFTTLGAAYCDLDDFATGRKYANRARAMSGKHASGELSSLYARIRSVDGITPQSTEQQYTLDLTHFLENSPESDAFVLSMPYDDIPNSVESDDYDISEEISSVSETRPEFIDTLERESMNRIWQAIPKEVRMQYYDDFELVCNSLKTGVLTPNNKEVST